MLSNLWMRLNARAKDAKSVLHKFAIPPIQVRCTLASVKEVISHPANVRQ